MAFIYLIIAFTLNSIANILLKLSATKGLKLSGIPTSQLITQNWVFITGLFLFALNVIFYFLALSKLPLSVAYPIMVVMSFLIVNAFSFYYFRENITPWQVVGYVLILVGISLVVSTVKV